MSNAGLSIEEFERLQVIKLKQTEICHNFFSSFNCYVFFVIFRFFLQNQLLELKSNNYQLVEQNNKKDAG